MTRWVIWFSKGFFQGRFARDRLGSEHDIAQHWRQLAAFGERKSRERQDVGGLVPAAPASVEGADMGIVGKDDAELGRAGSSGFGKGGRYGAVDQKGQRRLAGPIAGLDR